MKTPPTAKIEMMERVQQKWGLAWRRRTKFQIEACMLDLKASTGALPMMSRTRCTETGVRRWSREEDLGTAVAVAAG
jgi:hypothetical protein